MLCKPVAGMIYDAINFMDLVDFTTSRNFMYFHMCLFLILAQVGAQNHSGSIYNPAGYSIIPT